MRIRQRTAAVILAVNGRVRGRELAELFQHTSWARHRQPGQLRRMLARTGLWVTARAAGELVGFGRTITDGIFRALLDDIVVASGHRRAGLGRRLVASLLERLTGVEEVMLTTGDPALVRFYRPAGFRPARGLTLKRYAARSPS